MSSPSSSALERGNFDKLLERSAVFFEHLGKLAARFDEPAERPRSQSAAHACELTLEHATSLQLLFTVRAAATGCAVLRLQYEALLRAGWLLYAASDVQVSKLADELGPESQQAAKNLPGAEKMLQDLERALEQQPHIAGFVTPLREIRSASWAAMNSFVHAGIHPVSRSSRGFPVALAEQVVRCSNAMVHLAVRLIYRLSDRTTVHPLEVERSFNGFEDCLPILHHGP